MGGALHLPPPSPPPPRKTFFYVFPRPKNFGFFFKTFKFKNVYLFFISFFQWYFGSEVFCLFLPRVGTYHPGSRARARETNIYSFLFGPLNRLVTSSGTVLKGRFLGSDLSIEEMEAIKAISSPWGGVSGGALNPAKWARLDHTHTHTPEAHVTRRANGELLAEEHGKNVRMTGDPSRAPTPRSKCDLVTF